MEYNGDYRQFRLYTPGVFEGEIHKLGASVETLTERQCMDALPLTSLATPCCGMIFFDHAGPQCFPHLRGRQRVRANRPAAAQADEVDVGRAPEQLCGCFL